MSVVGLLGPLPNGYDHAGHNIHEIEGRVTFDSTAATLSPHRSFPIETFSFSNGNICFVVAKQRQGLPLSLARLCDAFVHIPHMAHVTTEPLLDTPSCLSILLHEFTNRAGYSERNFQGHKFDVARSMRQRAKDDAQSVRSKRIQDRVDQEAAAEEVIDGGSFGQMLFSANGDGAY